MAGNLAGDCLDRKPILKYLVILCVGIVLGYIRAASSLTPLMAGTLTCDVRRLVGGREKPTQQLIRNGMYVLQV